METLENKVIVYDDVCPMCKAYTAGFVRLGWLKHRTGFATASPELLRQIDLDRARHEIPLLDTDTGDVVYGLDALFLILGNRMPFLKPLFRNRFFRGSLYQLYQIITYNRRVIAGSGAPEAGFDCAPDVNLFYRWLYIALAAVAGIWLYSGHIMPFTWASGVLTGLSALLFPAIFFTSKKLDFIGHWVTIFLISALLISVLPNVIAAKAGVAALVLWLARKRWNLLRG